MFFCHQGDAESQLTSVGHGDISDSGSVFSPPPKPALLGADITINVQAASSIGDLSSKDIGSQEVGDFRLCKGKLGLLSRSRFLGCISKIFDQLRILAMG